MKPENIIFRRIGLLALILISALSALFITVTYLATTHFYQASTQLLNRDVAAHIAKFFSPFEDGGINKQKADSVFYNAMVISPAAEVYFLDTHGKIIYYQAADSAIKIWHIPLSGIREHIRSGNRDYIKSPDPKDPSTPKIFSAAEVFRGNKRIGYIYVILGSLEYRNTTELLFRSHISSLALKAAIIIILASLILSLWYIIRLQRKFNHIITVLNRFRQGDLNARFIISPKDEMWPITESFNKMASMLEDNINRLKSLESERRDFIANISHDLRTPLAIARGYTETLLIERNGSDFPAHDEYLELVLNKIKQVEKQVLQLFELSKIDAVNFKPDKEPFIFSEILEEMLNASSIQGQQKNIVLESMLCQDTAMIAADISVMERVIQNLLDNALKYTPENGRIMISMKHELHNLVLHIENTGEPLSKALLNWINNKGDESVLNRPKKAGLGLAIVKKIMSLHHFSFTASVNSGYANHFVMQMSIYRPSENPGNKEI
ncbi:HAMP domain-containing sensor histidine kinase [Daejeonella sp.]|uniref:HAMP domain-containing sensor histidine kinase n=1 Tax=Daejeonella sp. TaxID=2805397 RepID=UPI0030BFB6C1